MSCIKNQDLCHFNGSLGVCCSKLCFQVQGQALGSCQAMKSEIPTTTRTSTTSATTKRPCLKEGEKCRYNDHSMGSCCSEYCHQLKEEEPGECLFNEPPTGRPEHCLDNGVKCVLGARTGFCCSEYCHVLAPHTSGLCRDKIRTEGTGLSWVIEISIAVPVALIVLIAFVWLYWRQKRLQKVLSEAEKRLFFYGNPEAAKLNGYAHENSDYLPYDKNKWEITESAFKIDWSCLLGQGAFGLVLKANVRDQEVAAKTVKLTDLENASSHIRSLLSEIKTLQYIGTHDNIVNMVGSNTSNLQNGKVFLFLEYCPLGSLEKYLRENKSNFRPGSRRKFSETLSSEVEYIELEVEVNESFLRTSNLLNWCIQITRAMRHLEQKKVIHADLAARNVLLMRKDCAKLTDFGLSKRLYEYTSYVKKHQEPLPWRHMALEALKQLSFSHKSDVWSLGILFWEIFSFGDVPYPGQAWTEEFICQVEKNNMRPLKPDSASEELYAIMLECWSANPDDRPNFEEIHKRIWKCKEDREIIVTSE